jgi:CO dehydrogenase maturation factor
VKIAFVGKGGSGKTTLSSLFVRHLAALGRPVLAFDADINQHLATALGAAPAEAAAIPALGEHLPLVKDYLRGDNPRIASAEAMVKTTPPGRGSKLLRVEEDNPIYHRCVRTVGGVRLAVAGAFDNDDLGVSCYHSKVGAVELILNHLVDGPGEYAVVDMTAGADSFASGLFTRFDLTFVVCEPTVRSVAVYHQYRGYASDYGVRLAAIGNKLVDEQDAAFLREGLGGAPLASLEVSGHVRASERGIVRPVSDLELSNRAALQAMVDAVDAVDKDWAKFHRQTVEFHLRNAAAWGEGSDLEQQVDPDFALAELAVGAPA